MLKQESRDAVDKYPTLGDIPVLGSLFKSSDFQKSETELVIVVTAHLAKPLDKDKIKLPTDNYEDPDDLFFYWNIKTDKKKDDKAEGQETAAADAGPQTGLSAGKAALDGEFGQVTPKPLLTTGRAGPIARPMGPEEACARCTFWPYSPSLASRPGDTVARTRRTSRAGNTETPTIPFSRIRSPIPSRLPRSRSRA